MTRNWTGATSGNWSDPSNWSPAGTPATADTLVFPTGAQQAMTNDLPAGTSVGPMTFNADYALSGNALTLTGDLSFGPGYIHFVCNAPLKLANAVRFGAAIQSTYTGAIDVNGKTLTIDTYNTVLNGPIVGSGAIVTTGSGLNVNGSGTFSGTFSGTVDLTGSYPNATFTATRLSGNATVGAVTAQTLAPGTWTPGSADGHNRGTLQTGALSIGTAYLVDLVPGGTSDQIKVTGTVSLAGTLQVTIASGAPTIGQTFTIIDNDGTDPVSGTFSGLPEGATFTVGTATFRITYSGGDGNDVVLTVASSVKSWTGSVSGNWSDPQNWSPQSIPAAGEALLFPTGAQQAMTNDLPAGTSVGPMTFNTDYALSGNTLTLTGDLSFGPGYIHFVCNAPLKLANAVRFGAAIQSTYTGAIDVNGKTLTIDTYNTAVNGPIVGSGAIVTTGSGLNVNGSGTFSGTFSGTVDLTGSYPNATFTATRLSGNATVGAVTAQTLAPGTWTPGSADGHNRGTLQTGALSIGTAYLVDLVPGGTSDQVKVTGTVSLAGALQVTIASGAPTIGQTFTIIDNDGTDPVSGTFSGLPEGATFTVGTATFRISYHGGDGNDVVLTVASSVKSWTGSVSGNWSDPQNWSPQSIPAAGEALLFPTGAQQAMTNDLPAGTSVGPMTFNADYALSGNALTLTGDLSFGPGYIHFVCNAPLKLANAVRLGAAIQSTYTGAIDVNGKTLTIDTYNIVLNGPIVGSGAIVTTGSGLNVNGSGTFSGTFSGTVDVTGSYPNATFTATRLSGNATVGAVTAQTLAPGTWAPGSADGHNRGTLQTGPLSIGAAYLVDLVPGGTSDQIKVTGTVSLAGTLQVTIASGAPTIGQTFTIIDNDGTDPVSGTFSGLPEGATFAVGTATFRITYSGGDGNDVVLTVVGRTTTALTQSAATTQVHQPVTLTATVTSAEGVPDGTVSFIEGSAVLGASTLQNGVAALTISTLGAGSHTISASYSGSDHFAESSSAPLVHTVLKRDAHVAVTPSAPNAVYGDSTSFSIAVSAVSGSTTPSGTVTLTIDGSPAGTATLAGDGTATMNVPLIPAGAHSVTASYSGDADFNAASGSATQNVARAATVMTIDSATNPSPAGTSVSFTVRVAATAHPALPADGAVVVGASERSSVQAQLVSGAATVRLGPFASGDQLITAAYAGSGNFEPAGATLTQHVSLPALSVVAATIAEGDVAHDVPVRIQLSAAATSRVTVDYQTADGTALAGSDYVAAHGTATFEPGETSVAIPIRILGDTTVEPDETFFLQLSNAAGASIAAPSTTLVITNDDATYRAAVEYTYATADGLPLRLAFYAPAAGNGPWPLILWIPGNTAYDAAGGDVAALRETARGYAVAVVQYRPAAAAPFPAQIRDLQTAVRYLRANAATLNVNAKKFVAWGGGAGGHLAALLGSGYDAADADARVQAVVDWAGIADPVTLKADSSACATMDWSAMTSPVAQLLGCAPWQCPPAAEQSAPARYAGAGDAPALLMHGLADCFIPARQSQELYDALKAAGVDATLHLYDGIGHDDPFWTSDAAFHDVETFLDARLQGVSPRPRPIRH